jgi:hypothetical protein
VTTRPKLEIVDYGAADHVAFFVNGAEVGEAYDEDNADSRSRTKVARDIAEAVARALGADVEHADEPSRQPYTYFISYFWLGGDGVARPGSCWVERPTDIERGADTNGIAEDIMADLNGRGEPFRRVSRVIITGFTCTDGPY